MANTLNVSSAKKSQAPMNEPYTPFRTASSSFIGLEVKVDKDSTFELSPLPDDGGNSPHTMRPSISTNKLSSIKKSKSLSKSFKKRSKSKKVDSTSNDQKLRKSDSVRRHLVNDFKSAESDLPSDSFHNENMPKNSQDATYCNGYRSNPIAKNAPSEMVPQSALLPLGNKSSKDIKMEYSCFEKNIQNSYIEQETTKLLAEIEHEDEDYGFEDSEANKIHCTATYSTKSSSGSETEDPIGQLDATPYMKNLSLPKNENDTTMLSSPPVLAKSNHGVPIWTHLQNLFTKKFNICAPDDLSTVVSYITHDDKSNFNTFIKNKNTISSIKETDKNETNSLVSRSLHRQDTVSTAQSLSVSCPNTASVELSNEKSDSSLQTENRQLDENRSSAHTSVKVAIINEARGKVKLANMSAHPALLDHAMFRGFDGKRCHYNIIDPFASASTEGSVITVEDENCSECDLECEHKSLPPYWRNVIEKASNNNGEHKGFDAGETEAILYIRSKPKVSKQTMAGSSSRSILSPLTDKIRGLTSDYVEEIVDITTSNSEMTLNEKRIIHDFLNYTVTEDDYSVSTNYDRSKLVATTNESPAVNNQQKSTLDPYANMRPMTQHAPQHKRMLSMSSTNMGSISKGSVSSLHRRTDSEFTFTQDMLGNIYNKTNTKKQDTGGINRNLTPPRPKTSNVHNAITVKKANKKNKNLKDMRSPSPGIKKPLKKLLSPKIAFGGKRIFVQSIKQQQNESTRRIHVPLSPTRGAKSVMRSDGQVTVDLTDYENGCFLPKCSQFKEWLKSKKLLNKCIFEGWIGFFDGKEQGALDRLKANKLFQREDMQYAILLQIGNKLTMHIFSSPDGSKKDSGTLPIQKMDLSFMDITVSPVFISKRKGSCLEIRRKDDILCYILPVNLPQFFFSNDMRSRLVPAKMFEKIQRLILKESYGVPGKKMAKLAVDHADPSQSLEWGHPSFMLKFAPERQHDAALHLMFILNLAVKKQYEAYMKPFWNQIRYEIL